MKHNLIRTFGFFSILVGITIVSACASVPPYEPIAQAHNHIAAAKLEKAEVYFPLEFQNAQMAVQNAEKALYNYENTKAKDFADEARGWADLALVKTRWQVSNLELKSAEDNLNTLSQLIYNYNERFYSSPLNLPGTPAQPMASEKEIGNIDVKIPEANFEGFQNE